MLFHKAFVQQGTSDFLYLSWFTKHAGHKYSFFEMEKVQIILLFFFSFALQALASEAAEEDEEDQIGNRECYPAYG